METLEAPTAAADALGGALDLGIYGGVFGDAIGKAFLAAVESIRTGKRKKSPRQRLQSLNLLLIERAELRPHRLTGDIFQDWLLDRILDDINPLSRKLEIAPLSALGPTLLAAGTSDLLRLKALHDQARAALAAAAKFEPETAWGVAAPLRAADPDPARTRLKRRLAAADWPDEALRVLAGHYRRGLGIFGRYRAFRWEHGRLAGIAYPDPIRLDVLVGYEREREPLLRNTEQFVAGLPANDVLIAGARGTGKSSTVKALLNRYAGRGLRLVEVTKDELIHLPEILALLRGRPERFIVFVDDLSFEAEESGYKALKALLEGAIEARPQNVIVYATSNRRKLITERWAERAAGDDDVFPQERQEEKLSLADRFGIRVLFPSPDQNQYLAMVASLAADARLLVPEAELRQLAIRWELQHSGRSGRAAHQFIIWLLGEAGLKRQARPSETEHEA